MQLGAELHQDSPGGLGSIGRGMLQNVAPSLVRFSFTLHFLKGTKLPGRHAVKTAAHLGCYCPKLTQNRSK